MYSCISNWTLSFKDNAIRSFPGKIELQSVKKWSNVKRQNGDLQFGVFSLSFSNMFQYPWSSLYDCAIDFCNS